VSITDNDVAPPPVVTPPPPTVPIISYQLTVGKIGNGTVIGEWIDCGSDCNQPYTEYTNIILSAVPDNGWVFQNWGGDCDSKGVVRMDADKYCTAIFKQQHSLTITVEGQGTVNGCGGTCTFPKGETVILTTSAPAGWALDKWSGDCDKDGNVIMDSDKSCTAIFTQGYSLNVDMATNRGTVRTVTQECQENCEEVLAANSITTLIAEPKPKWVFSNWSGDCDAQGNVEMDSAKTCTAIFIEDPNIPNNGDSNADGIKDINQSHVIAMRNSVSNEYITIEVNEGVNITEVYTDLAENQEFFDDSLIFPEGIVYIEIEGSETDITIYYHGLRYAQNPSFSKFGPTTPGDISTIDWYPMPNVIFGTANIDGKKVVTVKYHLEDGELGDNTGVDGRIVDPGGIHFTDNYNNVIGFITETENVSTKTGEATLIVARSGMEGSVSVDYATANDSAIAGQDYQTSSGTLTWEHGEREDKIITIPILSGASTGKSLTVNLTNLTINDPQVAVLGLKTMTVNIYSNIIGFTTPSENLSIQVGTTDLTISRSGIHNDVAVDYTTVNDTAIANTDYQPLAGTLVWQDGDNADKTISLSLLDKAMIDKTLNVVLSNLTVTDSQTKLAVGDGILDTDKVAVTIISEDENVIGFTSRGYSAFKKKTV
jgi:hypothetical protein